MIQEDDDPCFSGLLILPSTEKVVKSCYSSCAIRDVNPFTFAQFYLSFLVLWKFNVAVALCPEWMKKALKKIENSVGLILN